jgi:hypothetical protein
MNSTEASPESIVRRLGLIPHPEGGYYKEVYRSEDRIESPPSRFGPGRADLSLCTSVYYLVEAPDFSAFHRIKSDELWYFHAGTGMTVHCLDEKGAYQALELGPGREYFGLVRAGLWFAAESAAFDEASGSNRHDAATAGRTWALVSCAVSPGFDFRDFELGSRDFLIKNYSEHASLVRRLTRG